MFWKSQGIRIASPPAEVHRVVGARRVPCGGENTAKQPHAGVSIALNSAPVKPEATLGCSYGVRAVFSNVSRDGEHPFKSSYTTIYERERLYVSRWLNGRFSLLRFT
jgi:hypothetical protein